MNKKVRNGLLGLAVLTSLGAQCHHQNTSAPVITETPVPSEAYIEKQGKLYQEVDLTDLRTSPEKYVGKNILLHSIPVLDNNFVGISDGDDKNGINIGFYLGEEFYHYSLVMREIFDGDEEPIRVFGEFLANKGYTMYLKDSLVEVDNRVSGERVSFSPWETSIDDIIKDASELGWRGKFYLNADLAHVLQHPDRYEGMNIQVHGAPIHVRSEYDPGIPNEPNAQPCTTLFVDVIPQENIGNPTVESLTGYQWDNMAHAQDRIKKEIEDGDGDIITLTGNFTFKSLVDTDHTCKPELCITQDITIPKN